MSSYSKYIKNTFYSAASPLPDAILNLYPKKILLPTYHIVTDDSPPHIKHLYSPRTKKEFIKDLDFILKFYKPIELHELKKFTREKRITTNNYFHLSFDDGLRECHDVIFPILQEKGIPATFFINPDFVDNKDLMFRYKASILIEAISHSNNNENKKLTQPILNIKYPLRNKLDDMAVSLGVDLKKYLKDQKPYMDSLQIKKLIDQGFTIGAHSMDHPEFSLIPFEEQIKQTKESISHLQKAFDLNYSVFAFPFNDHDVSKKYFDTILNPPLPLADLTFGVAGIKKDYHANHLQRIPMEKEFSGDAIIKGEYLYNSLKALIGKNFITRK